MSAYTRDLKQLCKDEGWEMGKTRSMHWRLAHRDTGAIVIASVSPRCPERVLANIKADMKRTIREKGERS